MINEQHLFVIILILILFTLINILILALNLKLYTEFFKDKAMSNRSMPISGAAQQPSLEGSLND